MKRLLIIIIVISMYSCATRQHLYDSKKSIVQYGIILEKIISENNTKEKSSLSGKIIETQSNEILPSARISFSSYSVSFEKGEVNADLNGNFLINKLKGGYYRFQVSFVGYHSFTIDSLFLEKGKNIFMKIGLEQQSTEYFDLKKERINFLHLTSRQPTMRAVSGGRHSPNLQTIVVKKRNNE